jgi:hypothetical protein
MDSTAAVNAFQVRPCCLALQSAAYESVVVKVVADHILRQGLNQDVMTQVSHLVGTPDKWLCLATHGKPCVLEQV